MNDAEEIIHNARIGDLAPGERFRSHRNHPSGWTVVRRSAFNTALVSAQHDNGRMTYIPPTLRVWKEED